ncbi:MAG: universal stress protein [Rhodospirillaceae bacterium]|jgi:nucleotide-binding universal stress UspA family protein
MPIRRILVTVDGSKASNEAMKSAFSLGKYLPAHVEVMHVRADPKEVVPLLGEGMSGSMIEDMIDAAESEAETRSQQARAAFDQYCSEHNVPLDLTPEKPDHLSSAWLEEVGREDEIVAWRGRLYDLIVMPRPGPDTDVSATMALNAALFDTGRPVLVVPPGGKDIKIDKIAIAWNGQAEAAESVAAASPLLRIATKAIVLTAESSKTPASAAQELATYLAWQGITADTQTIQSESGSVGAQLLKAGAEAGADIMIMGAYTHSRLRELILGGVTRHMLAEAEIPLIMAR